MKALLWCAVGLVLFAVPAFPQDKNSTEQAVAALEQQWLKAEQTSNPDLLAPLLADGFIGTSSDGKVIGKTETLAALKGSKYENAEYTDVKVAVFGDTAIATGGFKGKVTDQTRKTVTTPERWTDTWVKMPDGKMAMRRRPRLTSKDVKRWHLRVIAPKTAQAEKYRPSNRQARSIAVNQP